MGFATLQVAAVEPLTDDSAAVTFAVPPALGQEYAFTAGQSLTLRRIVDGVEHRRTYSICSGVGEGLRIGVREIPGLFSRWLVRDLRPGDPVEVMPPSGSFTLPEPAEPAEPAGSVESTGPPLRHLMIAAGSGITPVLSLLRTVLPRGHEATLLYGNRTAASVMFAEELADLKDAHRARFDLVHVLSREPQPSELLSGRLDAERLRRLLALVPVAALDHVWLCGPQAMVRTAAEVIAETGCGAAVHTELFHLDEAPPPPRRASDQVAQGASLTVHAQGRRTEHRVGADQSLLDAAQATRPELPYACKGGVCGTCRARLVDGEVEMVRNFALEDDEVAAGLVLTCQSYPCTPAVSVDFDG